jgi:hypothetical protein
MVPADPLMRPTLAADTPASFDMALDQLESIGRVKRPRQDHWNEDLPLPGGWVPARIHSE